MNQLSTTPQQEPSQSQWLAGSFAGRRKKTPALNDLQQRAFERFGVLGFPTPALEEWKYTNLADIARRSYSFQPTTLSPPEFEAAVMPRLDGPRLVFVNGYFDSALSEMASGRGVSLLPLSAANGGLSRLGHYVDYSENSLVALNSALFNDGALVTVKRGVRLSQPIQIIHIAKPADESLFSPLRNLIVLEEGAEAAVVEIYAGLGEHGYLTSAVTEVYVGNDARLDHSKLQLESPGACHLAHLEILQEARSKTASHLFSVGGSLVRNEINTVLNGEEIEAALNGLTVISDRQHTDNSTLIDHAKPNCFSREQYRAVCDDRAHGVFSGTIVVRQDAQKTNAIQSNQSLVLSDSAIVNSRPQLKIFADDVKCTHGATVGQLDDDALFYLRSRGIGREEARNLLIHAFASGILEQVPNPELKQFCERTLLGKLKERAVIQRV